MYFESSFSVGSREQIFAVSVAAFLGLFGLTLISHRQQRLSRISIFKRLWILISLSRQQKSLKIFFFLIETENSLRRLKIFFIAAYFFLFSSLSAQPTAPQIIFTCCAHWCNLVCFILESFSSSLFFHVLFLPHEFLNYTLELQQKNVHCNFRYARRVSLITLHRMYSMSSEQKARKKGSE